MPSQLRAALGPTPAAPVASALAGSGLGPAGRAGGCPKGRRREVPGVGCWASALSAPGSRLRRSGSGCLPEMTAEGVVAPRTAIPASPPSHGSCRAARHSESIGHSSASGTAACWLEAHCPAPATSCLLATLPWWPFTGLSEGVSAAPNSKPHVLGNKLRTPSLQGVSRLGTQNNCGHLSGFGGGGS